MVETQAALLSFDCLQGGRQARNHDHWLLSLVTAMQSPPLGSLCRGAADVNIKTGHG